MRSGGNRKVGEYEVPGAKDVTHVNCGYTAEVHRI